MTDLINRSIWLAFVDQPRVPVLAMNAEGQVVHASKAALSMLGVEALEPPGFALKSLLLDAVARSLQAHLDRVLKRGQACTCELRFQLGTKGAAHVRFNSQADDAAGAEPLCWSWLENITATRQAEQNEIAYRRVSRLALRASSLEDVGEKIMELLREHLEVDGGCIGLINESSGMIHYPVFVDESVPAPEPHAPVGGLEGYLVSSGQVVWWHDLASTGKSGGPLFDFKRDPVPTDLAAVPLKIGRAIAGFLILYRNRPDSFFSQREIELIIGIGSLLEALAARLRLRYMDSTLLASMYQYPGPVMITDKNGIIEFVNPAFEKITGYASHEAVGSSIAILESGRHEPAYFKQMWETIRAGKPWRGHFVNRCKNGELYEEDAVIWPMRNRGGDIAHFVAFKCVLQNQETANPEESGAADSSLFNRVTSAFTHDFRNMLLSIRVNADILGSSKHMDSREEVRQIAEASGRAEALLDNIAALTAPTGRTLYEVSLNEQIVRLQPLAAKLLGTSRSFDVDLSPRLIPVQIPSGLVEKILTSLLFYAQRIVPAGQGISIRTFQDTIHDSDREFFVHAPPKGDQLYSVLEMSGPGLAAGFVKDRARSHMVDLDLEWAVGLPDLVVRVLSRQGLLMVREGLGAQGLIRIYFEAKAGVASVAAVSASPSGEEGKTRGTETILVAEDDPGARRVMKRILEGQGYSVIEAENGATAIRALMFHEGKVDLLIADIMLPDLDGKALSDQISKLNSDIKILHVSGFDAEDLERQNIPLGSYAGMLVKKPFSRDELLAKVRMILSGS